MTSSSTEEQSQAAVAKIFQDFGLPEPASIKLSTDVDAILSLTDLPANLKWHRISNELLTPQTPFKVHQYLFDRTYDDDGHDGDGTSALKFIWTPTADEIAATNLQKFIKAQNKKDLRELFDWSDKNREAFWQSIVETLQIPFHERPDNTVFDIDGSKSTSTSTRTSAGNNSGSKCASVEEPVYFPNCKLNAVESILVGGDSRTAIVWSKAGESEENTANNNNNTAVPVLHRITLGELKKAVNQISNGIVNKLKLKVGDAVGIDMPMNWQSVAIYLGIIQAGLAVVSIADSFAPDSIAVRLEISDAKAIFTQDVIPRGPTKKIPLFDRVKKANAPTAIVLCHAGLHTPLECELRASEGDMSWADFMNGNSDEFETVYVDSMHIANILFSSGTTGEPKAIPWHHSTFVKPLSDGYLHSDIRAGEVVAWPTNVGWMMGPWLIAQMGLHAAIALYVGTPGTSAFCKFVECAQIAHLGVIPSMVKSWMKTDATANCDWSLVRRFSSTGEASNPTLYHWLVSRAKYSPVLEYVGGTEIAGGYLCGTMIQPQLLSSFSCPCLGLNIHIIDENGDLAEHEGELTISPPSIGLSVMLLNRDHRKVYYERMPKCKQLSADRVLRRHGDQIRIIATRAQSQSQSVDADAVENEENANSANTDTNATPTAKVLLNCDVYYQHLGRVDDTMNLGGIKTSSVALENVVCEHPLVSKDVAAIAYRKQEIDTESLVICVVSKSKSDLTVIDFNNDKGDDENGNGNGSANEQKKQASESASTANKTLGFQIAPVVSNDMLVVVSAVEDNALSQKHPDLVNSVLYQINDVVVYGRVGFKDVIQLINKYKSQSSQSKSELRFVFLHQRFNVAVVRKEIHFLVKTKLNPLFKVSDIFLLEALPRTASGKVMRRVLRKQYANSFV